MINGEFWSPKLTKAKLANDKAGNVIDTSLTLEHGVAVLVFIEKYHLHMDYSVPVIDYA